MEQDKSRIIDGLELAIFQVNDMLCAVETRFVQEINQNTDITFVHRAPAYVRGVINLRGEIVTVIDLRTKFQLDSVPITDDSKIIVVMQEGENIGLLVDSIYDVVIADRSSISSPPANVGGVAGAFFSGVYRMETSLVAILNLPELLKKSPI
jgi:purine-binding chemotaxis protein CheW